MTGIKFQSVVLAAGLACSLSIQADEKNGLDYGKAMYQAHGCYTCHGYNGTGKRPLNATISGIVQNDTVFLTYLRARKDVKPSLPRQDMPHYPATSLPDKDALAILAYIKTFGDQPPTVQDAEALKAIWEGLDSPASP